METASKRLQSCRSQTRAWARLSTTGCAGLRLPASLATKIHRRTLNSLSESGLSKHALGPAPTVLCRFRTKTALTASVSPDPPDSLQPGSTLPFLEECPCAWEDPAIDGAGESRTVSRETAYRRSARYQGGLSPALQSFSKLRVPTPSRAKRARQAAVAAFCSFA